MELLQKLWIRVSQNNLFWICSRICNYLWGSFIRGYVNAIMRQKKNVLWRKPLFAEKVLASQLLPASRGHPPPPPPGCQTYQNVTKFSKYSNFLKTFQISQKIQNFSNYPKYLNFFNMHLKHNSSSENILCEKRMKKHSVIWGRFLSFSNVKFSFSLSLKFCIQNIISSRSIETVLQYVSTFVV